MFKFKLWMFGVSVLVVVNILLLILVTRYWLTSKNKAAKIGFGVMALVYFLDVVMIVKGVV